MARISILEEDSLAACAHAVPIGKIAAAVPPANIRVASRRVISLIQSFAGGARLRRAVESLLFMIYS
jgi:hypothetical protein